MEVPQICTTSSNSYNNNNNNYLPVINRELVENLLLSNQVEGNKLTRHSKHTGGDVRFIELCLAGKYGPLEETYQARIPKDNLEVGLYQVTKGMGNLSSFEALLPKSSGGTGEETQSTDLLEALLVYCTRLRALNDYVPPYQPHPTSPEYVATFTDRFLFKLLGVIGQLTSTDSQIPLQLPSGWLSDTPLPPYSLQPAVLDLAELVVAKLPLTAVHLKRLVTNLAAGILHFQSTPLQLLFHFTASQLTLRLFKFEWYEESTEIPLPKNTRGVGIGEIILPILRAIAVRFRNLQEVNEALPDFKNWWTAMTLVVPDSLSYGCQYLLSQNGLHLNLGFQLLHLLSSNWLGHSTTTVSTPLFTTITTSDTIPKDLCTYLPYLVDPLDYHHCSQCQLRLDRVALVCLGCQSRCHLGCMNLTESRPSFRHPGLTSSLFCPGGQEFVQVTTVRTELCTNCSQPLWGTCLQAYQEVTTQRYFHLECIHHSTTAPSFPLLDFLLSQDVKLFTNPEEYLILKNYLDVQIALVQASPYPEVTRTLAKLSKAETILEQLRPNHQDLSGCSHLYSYFKLLDFLNRLVEATAPHHSTPPNTWDYPSLLDKVTELLECYEFTSHIMVTHLIAHGLLASKPSLDTPLSVDKFQIYFPFSTHPVLHQDYHINTQVLMRCFSHPDPVTNEFGFLLLKKLPPINTLPDPIPDHLIQILVEWVTDEDKRLSELQSLNGFDDWVIPPTVLNPGVFLDHYRSARRVLVTKFFLPDFVQAQLTLGESSFTDRIYRQSVLVHLSRSLERNLTPSSTTKPLTAHQLEGVLDLILRWRDLGLPDDIVSLLLDRWVGPFLESLEQLPPQVDAVKLTRQLLVDKISGIILVNYQGDPSSSPDLNGVVTLHSESFLYSGALRAMRKSDLSVPLSWFRLISIAQVLVPDLNHLIPQLLDHVGLDLLRVVDLFSFVFHQMVLSFEMGGIQYPADSDLISLADRITKPPISEFLTDSGVVANPSCQTLVELGVAISLLSAGILPPTPAPFSLPHLPLRFIPQISLILSSNHSESPLLDHLGSSPHSTSFAPESGSAQLLLALSMTSPSSEAHLSLQALQILRVPPSFLSNPGFLSRLWYLMNPAHVLLGTVALDLLFQAGIMSVTGLLDTIQLKPSAYFDDRWSWLDSAFGFLACLTPSRARKHPDAWQFIGPLFSTFVGFSLAIEESLRTKFETLVRGFEASVLKNLLQFWEIYFDSSKLDQKIVICRQMLQLHTLFPHWQVVQWRSLIGLLSLTINKNYDEPTKYIPAASLSPAQHPELVVASSPVSLKVLVITLCFQLLTSGLPIIKRELYTIKFLIARTLGFTDAQLDTHEGDYVVLLSMINLDHNNSDQMLLLQTFLSQLKLLLDGRVVMQDDKPTTSGTERLNEPMGTPKTPGSLVGNELILLSTIPTNRLVGEQFIDLFFKIANSNILSRSVSEPLLGEVIESTMILVYKYDLDRPTVIDTATPFLQRLTLLLTTSLPEGLTLSLINLCYVTLRRAPQITQLILASQVLVIAPLAAKPIKEDPIAAQARRFLRAAFSAYATNGLFMLVFKNYDYEKDGNTLFVALQQVLGEDSANQQGKQAHSSLSLDAVPPLDRPLFDVINRVLNLPSTEYNSFNAVMVNAARYVQQVHASHYGETLLAEYGSSFLPKLIRYIADWPPTHLDISPIYKMTAIIIRNHIFAAESYLSHIKQLLKATVGRFPFHASSLIHLLESIVHCYSEHGGREHSVEFGTVILDEFAAALVRHKPRASPNQIISLCQVLFHQSPVLLTDKGSSKTTPPPKPTPAPGQPDGLSFKGTQSLEATLLRLSQSSKLHLVFQEIPTILFMNMVSYLDDFSHFIKHNPLTLEAGLWGGHLLSTLFLLKEIPLSVIQNWLNGIDIKHSVLSVTWFFIMLGHISDADHLETLISFQPHVIRIVLDGLNLNTSEEFGSNSLSFILDDSTSLNFAYSLNSGQYQQQGQLTRLIMLLIKTWGTLFPGVDAIIADIQAIELEHDDPFVVSSLQASFWFTVWPAILSAINKNMGSSGSNSDASGRHTLPSNLVVLLFAHTITFLSQCQATIPSPHLFTSEWSTFLAELADFDPRLATDPDYRLAQATLVGEVVVSPFTPLQRSFALLQDLNHILTP